MGRIGEILAFTRVDRNGVKVTDVKIDPGDGANITADHFHPAGVDANPLLTDEAFFVPAAGTGREAEIGVNDPINPQLAQPGEVRMVGRDTGSGLEVVQVWVKNDATGQISNANGTFILNPDGSISGFNAQGMFTLGADGSFTGVNANGTFALQAGGTFFANGATIDPSGNMLIPGTLGVTGAITGAVSMAAPTITAGSALSVGGKSMVNHTHSAGLYLDGDSDPVTGNSGANN